MCSYEPFFFELANISKTNEVIEGKAKKRPWTKTFFSYFLTL